MEEGYGREIDTGAVGRQVDGRRWLGDPHSVELSKEEIDFFF
jgi:hypothetical protein